MKGPFCHTIGVPSFRNSPWDSFALVSTQYLLPCRCGRKIPIETTQAGQPVRCQCGLTQEVPTLRKIVALDRLGPALGAASQAKSWGTRQRVTLLGATILVVALGLMVVLVIQHPTMPSYPDPQQLSPLESLKFWEQMLYGPDISWLPPIQLYQAKRAAWWRWFDLDVVLALAGLITMAASLAVPQARSNRHAAEKRKRRGK